ncbi:unnamed protein product [Symbiodinium sp. KB8]|nr:unnamed protein product [Symbiodinium sp. KB8]
MDNKLLWTFDSKNEVSNAVFQAMRYGKVTEKTTGDAWTPKVLKADDAQRLNQACTSYGAPSWVAHGRDR